MELGRQDQAAEKNSVSGARQTLCIFGQLGLETVQVHKRSHQGSSVDIGVSDQSGQESHQ